MTTLKAIILGIVQGLTEFLPVSSSGHLGLTQQLLNIEGDQIMFFTAMLHFGTFISIVCVYYKDILSLFKEFFKMIFEILTLKGINLDHPHRKLGLGIIVATIPTAIVGLTLSDLFESLFQSSLFIGFGLLITGTLLFISDRVKVGDKDIKTFKMRDALFVGIFQSIAISPGISRSGSTIVGSLFRGLNKELAVRFSFLISLPAVFGAFLLEAKDAMNTSQAIDLSPVIIGILAAAISGYFAIRAMIKLVTNNKLHYFSYYTWAVGAGVIIYQLMI